MKRIVNCLLLVGFLAPALYSQDYVPGELLVIFKPGSACALAMEAASPIYSGVSAIDNINQANGLETFYRCGHPGIPETRNDYIFKFPAAANIEAIAALYAANPDVKWAGPNYLATVAFTPDDHLFRNGVPPQWAMDSLHLNLERAWDITKGDTSVVIAVIDVGTFWKHVDIETKLWINAAEDFNGNGTFEPWRSDSSIPGDLNGVDNDSNDFVDDVIGYNFSRTQIDTADKPVPTFRNHGTVTASLAGGVTNNGLGIASAGPSCRLMILATCQDDIGLGWDYKCGRLGIEPIRKALFYAARNGADVVNMSFGFFLPLDSLLPMKEAIDTAFNRGLVLVAAAHNNKKDEFAYPASYDAQVIGVASTDSSHYRSDFTSYSDSIDLTAPGSNWAAFMQSPNPTTSEWAFWADTLPLVTCGPPFSCDPAATSRAGTSLSVPMVAGVAGLLKSLYPSWKNTEIMAKLISSTDSIRCCPDNPRWNDSATEASIINSGKLGSGRLNAYKAVTFHGNIPNAAVETTLTGIVYVSDSIVVPPGKTLILAAGARFKAVRDNTRPNRVRVIVYGTLKILGSETDSVIFTSFQASPQAGDWGGIVVVHPGRLIMEFGRISYADTALSVQGDTATVVVYNSTFTHFNTAAVYSKSAKTRLGGIFPLPVPPDCGRNNFLMNTAASGAKAVIKSTTPGDSLKAEGNWWSQAPPQSSWFVGRWTEPLIFWAMPHSIPAIFPASFPNCRPKDG